MAFISAGFWTSPLLIAVDSWRCWWHDGDAIGAKCLTLLRFAHDPEPLGKMLRSKSGTWSRLKQVLPDCRSFQHDLGDTTITGHAKKKKKSGWRLSVCSRVDHYDINLVCSMVDHHFLHVSSVLFHPNFQGLSYCAMTCGISEATVSAVAISLVIMMRRAETWYPSGKSLRPWRTPE